MHLQCHQGCTILLYSLGSQPMCTKEGACRQCLFVSSTSIIFSPLSTVSGQSAIISGEHLRAHKTSESKAFLQAPCQERVFPDDLSRRPYCTSRPPTKWKYWDARPQPCRQVLCTYCYLPLGPNPREGTASSRVKGTRPLLTKVLSSDPMVPAACKQKW